MMAAWWAFWTAWPLFADAAITGACAGALLGGLGTFVLLGHMVFVSAALGQIASLGVALGMLARARLEASAGPVAAVAAALGASLQAGLGAGLATALGGLVLALQAHRRPERLEASLGLMFVVGSAGTLVAASHAAADLQDIQSMLFGSAVAVLPATCRAIAALTALVLGAAFLLLPALTEAWLDAEGARVRGLPLRTLQGGALLALTVSIGACTQALGALPTFAFSVAPALAALARCRTLVTGFVAAAALGAAAGFGGYVAAYLLDWPVGATQALLAAAAAVAAWLLPERRATLRAR